MKKLIPKTPKQTPHKHTPFATASAPSHNVSSSSYLCRNLASCPPSTAAAPPSFKPPPPPPPPPPRSPPPSQLLLPSVPFPEIPALSLHLLISYCKNNNNKNSLSINKKGK
ncbi:hypothetical protein POPTR_014G071001v4 [Populus trichocarpa]|uniref:Uncharacterized protein n=1 Tax=Populus trichocarpa TaxID=3694 RepID=A0ACC0RZZ9_POPTR|nr:hypothetical protein POPTR_014G071001v4 [Populus trichocarpa]